MALLQYNKTGWSLHCTFLLRGGVGNTWANFIELPLCLLLSREFLKPSNSRHIQAYGLKVLPFCPE